jgi:L-asparaginase
MHIPCKTRQIVAPLGRAAGAGMTAIMTALVTAGAQQVRQPPEVLVVATGGTIASTGNYYGDRGGQLAHISVEQLVKAAPGIEKVATLSAEQFSNVVSGSIGPTQWLELSQRINAAFTARPALAGVVVTHGTDTMEETAYFLDLTVAGDRPVVITGSMRPADALGADGPANLFNAVRVAAAPASRGRGAWCSSWSPHGRRTGGHP